MILNRSSESLSVKAIQRKTAIMAGKISGVISVANKNDFFFTLARYSLLITNRILCMITFFYFLNKNIANGRHNFFKSDHLAILHQPQECLVGRSPVQGKGKTDIFLMFLI